MKASELENAVMKAIENASDGYELACLVGYLRGDAENGDKQAKRIVEAGCKKLYFAEGAAK